MRIIRFLSSLLSGQTESNSAGAQERGATFGVL